MYRNLNWNRILLSRWHLLIVIGVGLITAFAATSVLAATNSTEQMEWAKMAMQLFGGLALFLFGMEQMADALRAVAGERMKLILAKLTSNRLMGAITGAFVTAVVQSSSVTTVLVVGFISAGLMSLAQSIGVIMGANIGTTITAQIVAFKVTKAALLMIATGFGMLFFSKQENLKHYGGMLMGLGLVFFGMSIMSDAMKPLRSFQPFLDLMIQMENPLVGILIAAAFTGLVQSSSATTGIVIVMASQGFITLPAGIALAFGANIGTCITAMLASIGKPREAVRAAGVHVLFNVLGVLIWIAFIPQLTELVVWLSPAYPSLSGADRLAAETPRQIANAHTVFNIANTIILIGFATQFARLVEKLVPDKPLADTEIFEPKYLKDELLDTVPLALDSVRREIGHMGKLVEEMHAEIMPAVINGDSATLAQEAGTDDKIDMLHSRIISYSAHINQNELSGEQTEKLINLLAVANHLKAIGDLIANDLSQLGKQRIDGGITVSIYTQEVLFNLHNQVSKIVATAIQSVEENNAAAADAVVVMKPEINQLVDAFHVHQAQRLVAQEPNRLPAYTIEIQVIDTLKRIYYHAKRMAKTVNDAKIGERPDVVEHVNDGTQLQTTAA